LTVSTDPNKKFRKELNSGIVSMVLLSIMKKAEEPMYGYQIAKNLEGEGNSVPMMKQGALYPVLRSLAAAELLDSHVDPSISGPPRRYYQITETGINTLKEWQDIWKVTKTYVDNILGEENV
jgi:PadR family transcriptional regulator PadR